MDVDCEVVICGAGPVGQLLGNLLGQAGVSTTLLDAAAEPYTLPRAATIDDDVLRIFQRAGLDEAVLAEAQAQQRVSFVTAKGRVLEVFRTADGALGHPPLVTINQPTMERTLLDGLERFGGVTLQRPCRVESVERRADHVVVWTQRPGERLRTPIVARWLVACDGAGSTVRSALGIPFDGSTFSQAWVVVDGLCDRPLTRVRNPTFVGDPERPVVTLPMSPGRHRWEFMVHPGEDPAPLLEPARIRALLEPWLDGERVELERAVVYTFHARRAARWRAGRVLLAGDAAHVMPPFAGQGFAAGARDAGNLAWKLQAVLAGAPESLLDTYETERRPHVTAMSSLAVRWGGIVQTSRPQVARYRDAVLTAASRSDRLRDGIKPLPTYAGGAFAARPARAPWRRGVGALFPQPLVAGEHGPCRLDDVLGDGWTAIARDGAAADVLRRAHLRVLRLDDELHEPGGTIAAWLDRHGPDWVVLRPDRFAFAAGATADAGDAVSALRRLLGTPVAVPVLSRHA